LLDVNARKNGRSGVEAPRRDNPLAEMNVLYVGAVSDPSFYGDMHVYALRTLGHSVNTVDTRAEGDLSQRRWLRRLDGEGFTDANVDAFNKKILSAARLASWDVIWFDKPLLIERETLSTLRQICPTAITICFQDDNPFAGRPMEATFWRRFLAAIRDFDVHIIKRDEDILNYERCGAKLITKFTTGYDPRFHYRAASAGATDVPWALSFIGTNIDQRDKLIRAIARSEIDTHVFGRRWHRGVALLGSRTNVHSGFLALEDVKYVIQRSQINLGLFSISNRDEYSARSFQIPACGGFFLAMRSPAHQSLYEEGREAEFFSSIGECLEKAKFYLKNEEVLRKVAENGWQRSKNSRYSIVERLEDYLRELAQLGILRS
jgi:spore maturation protein CgeB